jgi:hypothetical protein
MKVERRQTLPEEINPWKTKDPKVLLSSLDQYAKELLKVEGGKAIAPHVIMSHGFMSWKLLVKGQLSGMLAQQPKKERTWGGGLSKQDKQEKYLFDRFAQELFKESTFSSLTQKEKDKLQKKGWTAYIED